MAEELLVAVPGHDAAHLRVRERVDLAELRGPPMQRRRLLEREQRDAYVLDGVRSYHHAVVLQHHGAAAAERLHHHASAFGRVDLLVELQDRYLGSEDGASVADRQDVYPGNAECRGHRRMRVCHGVNLGMRLVYLGMGKALVD